MKKLIFVASILVGLTTISSVFASPQYHFSRIGVLPGDGLSVAGGINNAGLVLGASMPSGLYDTRGSFLWSSSTQLMDLQTSYGLDSPGGINNDGWISGTVDNGSEAQYAVLLDADGHLTRLTKPLGAVDSAAGAINDNGQIVGRSDNNAVFWQDANTVTLISSGESAPTIATDVNNNGYVTWYDQLEVSGRWAKHSFIWNSNGYSMALKPLQADDSCLAYAINDSGHVVGSSGTHAVVWGLDGNILMDLGIGEAYDINKYGQIVGNYEDRAVLWNPDGTVACELGAVVGKDVASWAYSINDSGLVVGSVVYDKYGHYEAALWQPVPEPSAFLVLTCGVAGALITAMKRGRL